MQGVRGWPEFRHTHLQCVLASLQLRYSNVIWLFGVNKTLSWVPWINTNDPVLTQFFFNILSLTIFYIQGFYMDFCWCFYIYDDIYVCYHQLHPSEHTEYQRYKSNDKSLLIYSWRNIYWKICVAFSLSLFFFNVTVVHHYNPITISCWPSLPFSLNTGISERRVSQNLCFTWESNMKWRNILSSI